MTYRGRFHCKVDSKGRLNLPVALATKAAASKSTSVSQTFVLTNNFNGQSQFVDVMPLKEWQALEKRIQQLPTLSKSVQTFQRYYLAAGQEVKVDSHGRLMLPLSLRNYAGINSEVVVVGMGNKFEIWSQKNWDQVFTQMHSHFDVAVEEISQLIGGI